MAKNSPCPSKMASFLSNNSIFGGTLVASLILWALWSFLAAAPTPTPTLSTTAAESVNPFHDPPDKTFYDDPELKYTINSPPVKNWDDKRREWLKHHPSFAAGAEKRILMVTGSQATPCKNPTGDYLLLKFFKNKVDYCRRHGIELFYNNVLFQPKMFSYWAKTPTMKAAMLAHPEVEWIWWLDADAAFTDMDFELPLDRYKEHNMVIYGWPHMFEKKSSINSINAGVFLIRNSQWAMGFMDMWSRMGPQSPDYEKWGEIQRKTFKDKVADSDDQSGLLYLLLNEKEKWGQKIYVENGYYFQGYWMDIVGTYDNITEKYGVIEAAEPLLRRRHAEGVSGSYARVWEEQVKEARRPFVTHFTGCQPCTGDHNNMYTWHSCFDAMEKALTFADNQVLKNYGFVHPDLHDPSTVEPLPFDYPA